MRDRKAYVAAGRNDPGSPEQMSEHPYDFVSLPAGPARGEAVGHDKYPRGRLTGTLTLVYETLTPLHVGSGVFETAADCGLEGGSAPVRGVARLLGKPILPGAGWKGAVRGRFEAITRSRLGVVRDWGIELANKVPHPPLRTGSRPHRVTITDPRVTRTLKSGGQIRSTPTDPEAERRQLASLSPAEALFGAMGYRGRVAAGDGVITGPVAQEPLKVAPMDTPAMHRLAKPGGSRAAGEGRIILSDVEGRKFYYDGPVLSSRKVQRGGGLADIYETVDSVPAGAEIEVPVVVESVTLAELGALLIAAGYGDDVGVLRFGGYKPAGLGKVKLVSVTGSLGQGSATRRWRRAGGAVDPDAAVAEAWRSLIDSSALRELADVTTRRRP